MQTLKNITNETKRNMYAQYVSLSAFFLFRDCARMKQTKGQSRSLLLKIRMVTGSSLSAVPPAEKKTQMQSSPNCMSAQQPWQSGVSTSMPSSAC
jgi:hypothetical protein